LLWGPSRPSSQSNLRAFGELSKQIHLVEFALEIGVDLIEEKGVIWGLKLISGQTFRSPNSLPA
jgi:hypothetical protein